MAATIIRWLISITVAYAIGMAISDCYGQGTVDCYVLASPVFPALENKKQITITPTIWRRQLLQTEQVAAHWSDWHKVKDVTIDIYAESGGHETSYFDLGWFQPYLAGSKGYQFALASSKLSKSGRLTYYRTETYGNEYSYDVELRPVVWPGRRSYRPWSGNVPTADDPWPREAVVFLDARGAIVVDAK